MSKVRLDIFKEKNIEKIKQLKQLGIQAFPQKSERTDTAKEALKKDGLRVTVAGRIMAWRGHGQIQFADLVDESGKIQLVFKTDALDKEEFNRLSFLNISDIVQASGETFTTKAGERTVLVKKYKLLTKAVRSLPDKWYGLKDIEERYRQRYVDLNLNKEAKQVFYVRTKLISLMRQFFDERGFLEVETPILQPIYGGATAKPFKTHHNALGKDFYLRIADELYLKRLIVGGFEKVYEIGHDFRNEGVEKTRNPEFTQIEFYWAYANYEDLMKLTEKLFEFLVKKIKGSLIFKYKEKKLDFTPPWPRVAFKNLLAEKSNLDLDKIKTETELLKEIKKRKINLDLKGVSGYAGILDEFYKKLVRPKLWGPMFLVDYPYEMKPLAKRKENNPELTGNFQLLIDGKEIVNAYDELNDPIDQRKRWEEDMAQADKGAEEYQVIDEDYLRALEYGMPPTAGWGLGVDRLMMILTGQESIKDVILFPTLKPEFEQPRKSDKYDYKERKIVAIVSNDLSTGMASNALGHLAFSAGHYADETWMGRKVHVDASGQGHTAISRYPFIVLGANTKQIKEIIKQAKEIPSILVVDYPQEMFDTGHDYELNKAISKAKEMTYHAVLLSGKTKAVDKLTKGLKLYD